MTHVAERGSSPNPLADPPMRSIGRHRATTRAAPATARGSSILTQLLVLTGRSIRALATDRGVVLNGILQPVVLVTVLTQVFSKIMATSTFPHGITYLDYLMPGVLVNSAAYTSIQSAVGLVEDMRNGVVARLRSLPIVPATMLLARSFADTVRSAVQLALLLIVAMVLFGYTPRGSVPAVLAAYGLTVFVGWALGWFFLALAAWIRKVEPVQNISFTAIFPLTFASSMYVPVADLPSWLAAVAKVNPLTYAINAIRALALDLPGGAPIVPALLTACGLAALGGLAAVLGFRRPDT